MIDVGHVLAINIGNATVTLARVATDGSIGERYCLPTIGGSYARTLSGIAATALYMSMAEGVWWLCAGVAIACPVTDGVIGGYAGVAPDWAERDLRSDLCGRLGTLVATLSRCKAMELAEPAGLDEQSAALIGAACAARQLLVLPQ